MLLPRPGLIIIYLRPDADEGTDEDMQPTCLSSSGFAQSSRQGRPMHHIARSVAPVLPSSLFIVHHLAESCAKRKTLDLGLCSLPRQLCDIRSMLRLGQQET